MARNTRAALQHVAEHAARALKPALSPHFVVWPMRAGRAAELLDSLTDVHIEDMVRVVSHKFGVFGSAGKIDEAAVRDAVSETFERLYRLNPKIDEGLFSYWYNAVCNQLRDELRHRKRFPMLSLQGTHTARPVTDDPFDAGLIASVEADVNAAAMATARPGPMQALLASEVRDALLAWLSRLPTRARMVLIDRYVEGKTSAEVADAMGLTEGAVRMTAMRATKMMREWLDSEYPECRDAWQETE